MKEGEDRLSLLYCDVAITFYPDYFVSYFNFQSLHYLNWNRNLSVRSYLAYLDDSLRHWCNPKGIFNTVSLKVWNEKKEKNITKSHPFRELKRGEAI